MIQKLLNRLIFIILLAVFPTLHFLKRETTTFEQSTDYLMAGILILSLIWLIVEVKEYLDFQKRRKKIVSSPNLINGIERSRKENYFNLRIISNENEFHIYEDNELKIYLDKHKNKIEIFTMFDKKEYSLNEIDFVVFEFLSTSLISPNDYGKIKWYCNFFIKNKRSDRLISLVAMISDRDNLKEALDYGDIDTNEFYYSKGLEIADILSIEFGKKYSVINHMERKTNKNN
ncbi:MAG TPA: hypothetical protein VMV56_08155 [Williamwhitmania sp.]|nr:hypothetical protein [Williamwhitmania sp.]